MAYTVRVSQIGFQVNLNAVLEICVGLGIFDSMGDADGLAINTTLFNNTGPLTDADNSRWFMRCCVQIPIGQASRLAAGQTMVLPLIAPHAGPHSGYLLQYGGNTPAAQEYRWYCEWDSKTKRTLRGTETDFVQLAMEARVTTTPAVGDDILIALDTFDGRVVKTSGGLAEPTP